MENVIGDTMSASNHNFFSRARHFAQVLFPMFVGVLYILVRDSEGSIGAIIGPLAFWFACIAAGITILKGLDKLE